VFGMSGIATHLSNGLLADGSWYEGENYHLFAHRGLWYGVTMAERAGLELPAPLVDRFQRGFATPFATALPDFTLPARRDSQYAISLRQWRIAEHCELGVARRADEPLLAALDEMYENANDPRPHDTGRASSSADVERNAAPSALSRADLSWRALLFAQPELPALSNAQPRSAILDAQGIAVFRRQSGRVYVALDYGHSGGGHGHPDRLNLTLAVGTTRWLDDFGTGSYVDPSLHWYRSTLAHNAPLIDGHSQLRVHGDLLAYEERDETGWVAAAAEQIAPGSSAARTLVVMPTYCLDVVRWESGHDAQFDLPLHVDAELVSPTVEAHAEPLHGGDELEDGYNFARDATVRRIPANVPLVARASAGADTLDVFASVSTECEWWSATALGAPGQGDHRFRMIRARGSGGECRFVWSWSAAVVGVSLDEPIRVMLADGTEHQHTPTDDGWCIEVRGPENERIELSGDVQPTDDLASFHEPAEPFAATIALSSRPTIFALGESHYRRSEQSWTDAGSPRATVSVSWTDGALRVGVDVPRSDRTFVAPETVNPYDNEPAEINGDGVQLYVRDADGQHAWLFVPIASTDAVTQRAIDGWLATPVPGSTWHSTEHGYHLDVVVPLPSPPHALDVIVNEMPRERQRRRGQLVLSGAAGEFVYLRGDRHDPGRLIPLRLSDE
jgi:hypothetical protein